MNIIETTAPIGIDELKKYFANKETAFIIDYANSELKGQKLLTYISNLDLPIDVVNFDHEFIKDYFESSSIVSIPSLENEAILILFEYKGILDQLEYGDFIKENEEILLYWKNRLDSLSLFNLHTIESDELGEYVKSFPSDQTADLKGVNFISLLKHETFYEWFKIINEDELVFYTRYFDDYMFKGSNLYSYWANENNPMFLLTWGIASGEVNEDEYVDAKQKDFEEIKNATLA